MCICMYIYIYRHRYVPRHVKHSNFSSRLLDMRCGSSHYKDVAVAWDGLGQDAFVAHESFGHQYILPGSLATTLAIRHPSLLCSKPLLVDDYRRLLMIIGA